MQYAKDGHITEEVKYMGGLVGGGVLVSCGQQNVFLKKYELQ